MRNPGELLERERELDRIDRALQDAARGEGATVVVEGPAGIGKSRMLAEVRRRAAAAGVRVLRAHGGALERDIAYGAVRLLLERELARLPDAERDALLSGAAALARPVLEPTGEDAAAAPDRPDAVLHGLYWLLSNLAERGPLLLCLDDAHWFDAPSLRFLLYLARRCDDLPVLIVACTRRGDDGPEPLLVEELLALAGVVVVRPQPLTEAAVAALLRERSGHDDIASELSAACREVTGGNPFLLGELATELLAAGAALDAAGAARVRQIRPAALARSIVLRLGRMPPACGALATAVAVLGEDAALYDVARLAGLDAGAAMRALDRLVAAEILADEQPLAFVHPIVREAVYGELGPGERADWHTRAAGLLPGDATDPGRLASHLLHTAPGGCVTTVTTLRAAAAGALRRGAPDIAARYLRRALAEPPEPGAAGEVLLALGSAAALAGEHVSAFAPLLRAAIAQAADTPARALAWLTLARATFMDDDAAAAVAIFEEAIADLADPRLVATLEAEVTAIGLMHAATCEQACARIERRALPSGDSRLDRLALCNHAALGGFEGRPSVEVAELCRRAIDGGRFVAETSGDLTALYQVICVLAYADALDEARAAAEVVLADARARGAIRSVPAALAMRALVSYRAGAISDCVADCHQALAVGVAPVAIGGLLTTLTLAMIERGELDDADALLASLAPAPDPPEFVYASLPIYGRGMLRLAQGRTADAAADLLEFGRRAERMRLRVPAVSWRADAAVALHRAGERRHARELLDEYVELAERWGTASAIAVGLRTHGLLADGAEALALLRDAADLHAASPMRHEYARTLYELGRALRRSRRRSEAVEVLRRAVDLGRGCGALATAERAHEELVVAGARPRRLQFSGVDALTPGERRVAQLAADGLTNREIAESLFLTAKTVENHLGRIYTKLGIRSRARIAPLLSAPAGVG